VIEGGKAGSRCAWPCIDAPTGPGSLGEQAETICRAVEIGSKVHLLSQTVDRLPHRAEVIGEVNLNWRWWKRGWPLPYLKYLGQCDEGPISMPNSGPAGAAMACGRCLRITRPWDFRRSRRSSRSAAEFQNPFPAGRAIAAVRSAPCPRQDCCALEMTVGRTIGTGIFFHFAMWFHSCSTSMPSPDLKLLPKSQRTGRWLPKSDLAASCRLREHPRKMAVSA